ncbi:WecB/TagA/CpsF family glycosyltransferase [Spirosoma litoris]
MSIKRKIISINVTCQSYSDFVQKLTSLAAAKSSSYICVANVHMCIEAYKDKAFAAVVNGADIITPDGMPLVKALRLLYGIDQDRVAGMDLLPDLLKESENRKISVFFYGGTQTMLDKTADYCKKHYPALQLAGFISPPFRALTTSEEEEYINHINASKAGFVFVALGCPKQEKWMAAMKGKINASMVGIGGALPVMVGMQKRAPDWMQKASLEWLYRLGQEPKRLFKRYAVTNTMFIVFLFKQWLFKKSYVEAI